MNAIIVSFQVEGEACHRTILHAQKGTTEKIFDFRDCCNIAKQGFSFYFVKLPFTCQILLNKYKQG